MNIVIDIDTIYRQLIKKWSEHILNNYKPSDYYRTFIDEIKRQSGIYICFDERIKTVLLGLLKSYRFQIYNK